MTVTFNPSQEVGIVVLGTTLVVIYTIILVHIHLIL